MSPDSTRTATPSATSTSRLADLFLAFVGTYKSWLQERLSSETGVTQHRAIGELGCNGPMQMNALGREIGVTPRYVTAIVDQLEEDGLARRRPHPEDRRATLVELTEEGQELYRRGTALFRDLHEELLGALTDRQREALLDALEALLPELRRLRGDGGGGGRPFAA